MLRKNSRRFGSEARRTSMFSWGRKRGGAGSVACTVLVALVVISLAFTAAAKPGNSDTNYVDEPRIPEDEIDGSPSVVPHKVPAEPHYTAGIPSRIPV